jgi:hypothetical protein
MMGMEEVGNLCIENYDFEVNEKFENFIIMGSLGDFLKIYKKERAS